jgi:rhodanese-related sulfurtransferase
MPTSSLATWSFETGFDAVAGYLAGGIGQARDDLCTRDRAQRISGDALAGWVARKGAPLVIDVRNQTEWDQARIEPAMLVPLSRLTDRLGTLSTNRPIVVYCASGYRSSIAASILRRKGLVRVAELAGGLAAQPTLVN